MEILLTILNLATLAAVIIIGLLYKHYLPAYLAEKGKHLATREDFHEILRQVERTTAVTKSIESKISQGAWVGQSELEYRKEQLADFYGPIYAYLKTGQELYDIWMKGKIKEINLDIIRLFRKQNEEIANIIITKAHLIDGGAIPEVFTRFITSTTIWNFYTSRPDKPFNEPEVEKLEEVKWPKDFREYIFSKTEELKRNLDRLYKKYGID